MKMWFRAPASIQLRRAQLTLMLATLIPTILMTALGIVLLVAGSGSLNLTLVAGVLTLAFTATSITGYILGSIFVSRGASLARVQHDFVSSVSHELRTPLTSIRMFIETLKEGRVRDEAEQRQVLDVLFKEVERLEGLVGRVIDLSRIETEQSSMPRNRVAVQDVVSDALKAYDAASLSDPTPVSRPREGLHVKGDRSALSIAVSNLLVNAWKYTPSDSRRIWLQARRVRRRLIEISVRDNGPGIPREERERVFEEFERGRAAIDSRASGSGLGLAIVRAIVGAHRGRVELRSRGGKGAEFRIRLREGRRACGRARDPHHRG
ncbi:MAG: sensor histidine kinase [Myxococcales bacterium]|nr:sensor histidine kinase [Myxococcales bacterium]